MGKKETPRMFTKKEKMEYIRLHLEERIAVKQNEKEYGIGYALVSSWGKHYLQDGEDALAPRNRNPYGTSFQQESDSSGHLCLLVAKQEVEIARQKRYWWKELVQTGNTLLETEGLRSS